MKKIKNIYTIYVDGRRVGSLIDCAKTQKELRRLRGLAGIRIEMETPEADEGKENEAAVETNQERIPNLKDSHFDGATYEDSRDKTRLTGQLLRIFNFMKCGTWRTLAEIAVVTEVPEASVSAQLRNLRKKRFGDFHVAVRRSEVEESGLHEYRLDIEQFHSKES